LIKCAFYGAEILYSQSTNSGQWRGHFQVVIAGSNAYIKEDVPTLPGYNGPISYGGASINAPYSYVGFDAFPAGTPWDPTLCAKAVTTHNQYVAQHGGDPYVFFDAYMLYKNGANGVFTCSYYSQAWGPSYATNTGQTRGRDVYTIGMSYGYAFPGYPFQ
jgi:hypothetical protein